jgi:hypothetical protein
LTPRKSSEYREKRVNSLSDERSCNRIAHLLGYIREKGVRLWSAEGRLCYAGPKDALVAEDIAKLRMFRAEILSLLETCAADAEMNVRLEPRLQFERAPTSFSQLWHWHSFKLERRTSARTVAFAARLRGKLNITALRESIAAVVRQHEALRTRIVVYDGIPTQEIARSLEYELEVDDLEAIPRSIQDAQVLHIIEEEILKPIDFATGPLFGARLVKIETDDHVFVVGMDHMISDAFSMNVLLRDISTCYIQAARGVDFSLPDVPIQFADYAAWQRKSQASWVKKYGAYWGERLAVCEGARFPIEKDSIGLGDVGVANVTFEIRKEIKIKLGKWCLERKTTLPIAVLTSYVALVLRWCDTSEAVIQYQTSGRGAVLVENTIGYFASLLALRIRLDNQDTFDDLTRRVIEEYCHSHERSDCSYMATQVSRSQFAKNTIFNWVPRYPNIQPSDLDWLGNALTTLPISFSNPTLKTAEWDHDPEIVLFDTEKSVVGKIYYPSDRFSPEQMGSFCRNFMLIFIALLTKPEQLVKDVAILD